MQWIKNYTPFGVMVAGLVAMLPFVMSRHLFYGAINSKYFYLLCGISVLALYGAYLLWTRRGSVVLHKQWLLWAGAAALVVAYLAAVFGVYPERSFFSDITRSTGVLFLTYVALLAWLSSVLLTERDWSLVRRAIAASAALFSFFTILGTQGLGLSGRILTVNLDVPGISISNETFAGAFLVLAMGLTLVEFARSDAARTRWLLVGAVLVQLLSPLLLNIRALGAPAQLFESPELLVGTARASSVTALLLLGFVVTWFLLHRYVSVRGAWAYAVAVFVGVVVAVVLLFTPGSFIQEAYIEQSTAARPVVWESGLQAFSQRPLLGWGPENFRFAFEKNFDNRLYLQEYYGEVWFDRAHNILVDTAVSRGVLGLLAGAALVLLLWVAVVRALRASQITSLEAIVLMALPVAHTLQMQTGFDTPTTYVMWAMIFGYVLWLERSRAEAAVLSPRTRQILVGGIVTFVLVGALFPLGSEYARQKALFGVFTTENVELQLQRAERATERVSDYETLRLLSVSFSKGLLESISDPAQADQRAAVIQNGLVQLSFYGERYRQYIEENPTDYRPRMNYVYLLFIQTVLGGESGLAEARKIIEGSYALSPGNPLTASMHALAFLYEGDIETAKQKINEAIALNPEIEFTHEVREHILKQEASFPTISILKLENI